VDFFGRQERSRRNTRILVGLFALAVVATVTAVTLAAAVLISMYQQGYATNGAVWTSMEWFSRNGGTLLAIAAFTAGFIGITSLYRIATVASGGGQVARLLGGTEISPATTDLLERRLVNVVEEMAIASGTPVPDVFVLEREQGINAFAAGLTPADAAIAVTRGTLDRLTRAELQGVIAHEFSHVLNGDMRLNQQLVGLSFGILALSLVGRWLLRSVRFQRRSRSGSGAMAVVAAGAILVLIGSIGLFSSRLIKAGVSRQREMLADASAVQFTRDRLGLAGALKKIGGYTGSLAARNSEEVAHMLFARGAKAFRGLLATHPPLDQRILALDPSFVAGGYPNVSENLPAGEPEDKTYMRLSPLAAAASLSDGDIVGQAGTIAAHGVAAAMRVAIPEAIDHAAHSRELSLLLVLALGLSRSPEARRPQLDLLERQLGAQRAAKCRELAADLGAVDDQYRLPILELSMPALKHRPVEQLGFLVDLLRRLTELNTDEKLFDYVLLRVLESYLRAGATTRRALGATPSRVNAHRAVASLLGCVAAWGHDDPAAALGAYRAGIGAILRSTRETEPPPLADLRDARKLETLDAALVRLEELRPRDKQRVLAGVLACIRHDRRIAAEELELFRAIAAALGCPMPPATALAGFL
jgi:Zn-dependent protease with chaperone function